MTTTYFKPKPISQTQILLSPLILLLSSAFDHYQSCNHIHSSSSTFGKFLRQHSNDLSSTINKGISTLKHSINDQNDFKKNQKDYNCVMEFNLSAPTYGFDEAVEVEEAVVAKEIGRVVRVLRQRLPIQDWLMKMKIARNCFAGSDLVEFLVRYHGCAPSKVH